MSKNIHTVASTNFAMYAYDQGFEDALVELVKTIDTELTDLAKYGRTELYGLHKTKSLVLQLKQSATNKQGK